MALNRKDCQHEFDPRCDCNVCRHWISRAEEAMNAFIALKAKITELSVPHVLSDRFVFDGLVLAESVACGGMSAVEQENFAVDGREEVYLSGWVLFDPPDLAECAVLYDAIHWPSLEKNEPSRTAALPLSEADKLFLLSWLDRWVRHYHAMCECPNPDYYVRWASVFYDDGAADDRDNDDGDWGDVQGESSTRARSDQHVRRDGSRQSTKDAQFVSEMCAAANVRADEFRAARWFEDQFVKITTGKLQSVSKSGRNFVRKSTELHLPSPTGKRRTFCVGDAFARPEWRHIFEHWLETKRLNSGG